MRRRNRIPCWLVLVPVLCACVVAAGAEEPPAPRGMVIYRDPATGQLSVPPPGVVPPGARLPRQPAIVETPGTTRAGGWKASGRFMNTMRATAGADGEVTVDCVPGASGGTD